MPQVHLVFLGNTLTIQNSLHIVFYRFHVYYHVRIILHHLGIPLPHEDSSSKINNSDINSANYSICDDNGSNTDET